METVYTPAAIQGDHVVLTGPITGTVTLPDGTVIDVSAPFIAVDSELRAAEVAHAIGLHWEAAENVHPTQIDVDPETGQPVVNEFVYDDSHYQDALAAAAGETPQEG